MKRNVKRILVCSLLGCALTSVGAAQGRRGRRGGPPAGQPTAQAGTYTNVSGTISQFNYDRDAEVEGFLLSNNTLVHLPPRAAARMGTSLRAGDTVRVGGFAQTSPTGFQTMEAQAIQDSTSGKSLTVPQPGAAAPYSGSGRIQQLNYGPDGAVNGFLLDNGTLATVPPFAATNPSFIRRGATIAYSGYAHSTMSGRNVVDVQTLTVNGQALTMGAIGPQGGTPAPPPAGPQAGPGAPPPPPVAGGPAAAPPAPGTAPAPAGRGDEPPPPPPPPALP